LEKETRRKRGLPAEREKDFLSLGERRGASNKSLSWQVCQAHAGHAGTKEEFGATGFPSCSQREVKNLFGEEGKKKTKEDTSSPFGRRRGSNGKFLFYPGSGYSKKKREW